MNIDEAINKMLTCATDLHCKKEEACFAVAKWAMEARASMRTDRISHNDDDDMDAVANYAPGWEIS